MKIEKIANGTEYASIGLSLLGTIATIATQQIAYIAAPLTLSVSLSLLNRKRELTKTNRYITRLEQQLAHDTRSTIDRINTIQELVAVLPSAPTAAENQQISSIYNRIDNLDSIIEQLQDNNSKLASQVEDYHQYNILVQTSLYSKLSANDLAKYEYELVLGREQSRQALLESLSSVKQCLILVCPWLCHYGFDKEIYNKFESLLIKGVAIEIGYGKLSDIEKGKLTGFFYDSLQQATSLADRYPNFKLKLIGTHEKYLVCDRSFAMLGSHNFLTSGVGEEREIGIRTTDPNLIDRLIERYEQAPNLEHSYSLN